MYLLGIFLIFRRLNSQSTLMQYLSPTTFSGETLSAPLDKKAIQLGRKKLFAELELSGESTIELHGKPFTKNDIIKYFEDLLKEDALSYHSAVGEDRVLLVFLENAWIGRKEKFQDNPLYKNEQFIQWISPYFCHSFMTFMDACFQGEPDEYGLTSLLNNKLLMTPGDIEKSWSSITRIIMDDISILEQYHVKKDLAVSLVSGLMEFSYIRMIQMLPQGRFASLRDKYALCMQNVCIDIFNKHKSLRSHVKTWLENAKLLADSQEIKNQIIKKLEEMDGIQGATGEKKKESSSSPLKIILFILIAVVRIATCKSFSSSSNYNYNNYQNTPLVFPQNSSEKKILDSLINKYRENQDHSGSTDPDSLSAMDTVTFTHKIHRRSAHKK